MHAFGRAISERGRARPAARDVSPLLKPDGLVIIGDIVPPHLAAPAAALALLRFGAANGFFWAAVGGLIRIFVSDYLRLKKTRRPVALHASRHAGEAARRAGFRAERATRNIGHNQWRMTFLARPRVTSG